ncbi:hypothetical protein FN846DRAFT_123805 [Sphaerosporella brunnea]|uniref:Uncharacterized protein n=1 Tax=Sphaerosporella brunnea TaxID=1250544 RepID=A0A5J5EQX7_9PEZI|nr:hypothetical protein FN846DRAFT_123805 [Sphaerosporella brunnea]
MPVGTQARDEAPAYSLARLEPARVYHYLVPTAISIPSHPAVLKTKPPRIPQKPPLRVLPPHTLTTGPRQARPPTMADTATPGKDSAPTRPPPAHIQDVMQQVEVLALTIRQSLTPEIILALGAFYTDKAVYYATCLADDESMLPKGAAAAEVAAKMIEVYELVRIVRGWERDNWTLDWPDPCW